MVGDQVVPQPPLTPLDSGKITIDVQEAFQKAHEWKKWAEEVGGRCDTSYGGGLIS